uniref:Uncharacterized protein n=1 Tax=Rhizobium phage IG49 TaxID=3129228 RepID=A0AAU8HYD9_9CAUD
MENKMEIFLQISLTILFGSFFFGLSLLALTKQEL